MSSAASVNPNRNHAVILVGVLWLVLILGLLLLGLNRQVQLDSSRSQGQLDAVRAHWLARAGIERALAVLADDSKAYDGMADFWYADPLSFQDIELADGFGLRVTAPPRQEAPADTPRFGLDDEASRINLNRADRELLSRIDQLDPADVSPLIDWVDGNEEAEPGGAERGYYQRLGRPYEIRNAPMRTLREPLLVKGITAERFFAEDVNGDGVLQRNENDGETTWPSDVADGALDRGISGVTSVFSYELNKTLTDEDRINLKSADASTLAEQLSVTRPLADRIVERAKQINSVFELIGEKGQGEGDAEEDKTNEVTIEWLAEHYEQLTLEEGDRLAGRVNVNTAERNVLEVIPGLNPSAADAIVQRRATSGAFTALGDLISTGAINHDQFRASADYLTVRSSVMTVRSTGYTPSGARRSIVAVIDRGGESPFILYWWQSE